MWRLRRLHIISLLLYPIQPFISILLFIFYSNRNKEISNSFNFTAIILTSIFLGFINTTKIYSSDLLRYIEIYRTVEITSFYEFIIFSGKEPIFQILTFVIYHLSNGSENFFIFITTFCSYMFFLTAVLKFYNANHLPNSVFIVALVLAAFFPQNFSLSAHLIRQFLAASILFYAIVNKIFYDKKIYYLLIVSVLIHSTTLLFIPFIYLNFLKKDYGIKSLFILVLIFLFFSFFLVDVSKFIIEIFGNNIFTYAFQRVSQNTSYELKSLSFISYFTLFLLFSSVLYYKQTSINQLTIKAQMSHFFNIFFILSFFILANINLPEFSVRFFFYVYFYIPFIIPLIFSKSRIEFKYLICITIIAFFILNLEYGIWQYSDLAKIIFGGIFNYF